MKSIYAYTDYRAYLRDYYQEKKEQSRSYSFRYFARKANLDSPNYYKLVMDGERNLTHKNIRKFAKGLGLGERETLYFENLVYFNQAKGEDERAFFEKNLQLARAQDDRVILTRDQFEVLTSWYPLAIKEAALLKDFQTKPKWIASRFDYRFTPQQAKEAVDLLARLGLVEVHPTTGVVTVTTQSMQTPDIAKSDAAVAFHKNMIDLAKEAVDGQTSDQRCLSALTVAVRKKDLAEAFRKIHEFRNQMDEYFSKGKPYDAVYQLNLQLFRLDNDA
ncbi:MAG TPA: TIGR02147 family protein [Bdellovibrionota bacterium]|nr:TIGR02147 family protein [Bdellovibrionota bacterium]